MIRNSSMATYESAMLSFAYDASLHIHHPTLSLQNVTERLGLTPRRTHNAGDPRRTPKGTTLKGSYPDHYWSCSLSTKDQENITDFLRRILSEFEPNREFLNGIAKTGGEVCLFLGVFSSRCCAHQFSRELLADLAATGLDLRIDFYGSEHP
jgi:hypothetical protein